MRRFLDEVLDALDETHDSFEDLVFILPNKRAGTFLLNAVAKRAQKTAFAPRILSIEELLEKLSGLKYASRTLQLFELYHAYQQVVADPEPFHEFLNWAGPVLQDFNEIDRYMVDPEKLFAYLSDIHEIRQWGITEDSTPMIQNYLKFWKDLYPLYTSFLSNLKSKGYAHPGGIYKLAAEKADTYVHEHSGIAHVFIGFNALTTAETKIIQNFLQLSHNTIYWDMDSVLLQDSDHDASYFLRQYQLQWERIKKEGPLGISAHYSASKKIHAVGVPKRVSQAQYVGNLLNTLVEQDAQLSEDLAVVLGDESLLNPLLHSMPESIKQMNITMGYPLEKIPLAAFFKQLLTVFSRQEHAGWPVKSILELMDQPYFLKLFHGSASEVVPILKTQLQTSAQTNISPEQLRNDSDKGELLATLFPRKPISAREAIEHITRVITHLKDLFDLGQKQIELEYLHGFYRIFNQLSAHVHEYSFLKDVQSLLPLYESLVQLEHIDLRGEPLQGLQIMGMLESRVLDYETVIITSVNEGILPAGKSDSSLIPFDVKREFGLPTYKEKDAIYTYHFYRLLQRAKQIYLVYNTEPDVLLGGEKSRLIMQLQSDPVHRENFIDSLAVSKDELVPKQAITIQKTPKLMETLATKLYQGISPTLLATYIRDPLEFYKKAVLDIPDTSPDSSLIDAMMLGTLTHKAAERLYEPLKRQVLSVTLLQEQKGRIVLIVDQLFKQTFPKAGSARGRNYLAYHVVLHYLKRLLDHDIQTAKQHQLTILDLETKLDLELKVPGLGSPVRLRGVADRIDRCDDGLRIIDYKTGGLVSNELRISSWIDLIQNEKRQKAFQVLCYALMVSQAYPDMDFSAGIISFKQLKKGFIPFEFKTGRKAESNITNNELKLFKEQLILLLQEICNVALPFEERLIS